MAKDVLGITIDIHGGGHDLIFPHHENEIAQSVCAHGGVTFSKYWMHNGFLVVNGEKMSKSLGNFFTVRELLAKWPGEAIRLLLLKTHYRAPLDFTDEGLREAKGDVDRFYQALRGAKGISPSGARAHGVLAALCDDLNTSKALAEMHELARRLNVDPSPDAKAALLDAGALLGLLRADPDAWFKRGDASGPAEQEIEAAIAARLDARKRRDFAEADRIRNELKQKGVVLEDVPGGGTTWKRSG